MRRGTIAAIEHDDRNRRMTRLRFEDGTVLLAPRLRPTPPVGRSIVYGVDNDQVLQAWCLADSPIAIAILGEDLGAPERCERCGRTNVRMRATSNPGDVAWLLGSASTSRLWCDDCQRWATERHSTDS